MTFYDTDKDLGRIQTHLPPLKKFVFNLFLAALGLCCFAWVFSSCSEWGLLLVVLSGHWSGISCCEAYSLSTWASVVVARGLSCFMAFLHQPLASFSFLIKCGIFLDRGSNPCPLHWQTGSYPLSHQGSPDTLLLIPTMNHTTLPGWGSFLFLFFSENPNSTCL